MAIASNPRYQALIGGAWEDGGSGRWFADRNPADPGEIVAEFPALGAEDVGRAVDAARRGFAAWRALSITNRGAVLLRAAALIRERAETIARDITREMGKPLKESRGEALRAAIFFEYYGSFGRWPIGNVLGDERPGVRAWSVREPIGVVALIAPWNDPFLTPARKLGPALIAGNAVVMKPASLAPLAAHHMAAVLADAGLPAGALNLVTGGGSEVGNALVDHPAIAGITFTGSTSVGLGIQGRLAGRNVRVQTEMGGKNAAVVLRDADLDLAVESIIAGGFGGAGQRCTATSRVIVDSMVYDAFCDLLVRRASALRVGAGLDDGTEMGPLVDDKALETALRYVELGKSEGARLSCGGNRVTANGLEKGYFVEPTVFTEALPAMRIWREEIFGPVLSVGRVDSVDEAIAVANDSDYGLSAAVYTNDLGEALRFAESVEAGDVAVNLPTTGWDVHLPFGGFKDSGSPFKEQGLEGLQFYTRTKTVVVKA